MAIFVGSTREVAWLKCPLKAHARQAPDFAGAKFSSFPMFYNFVRRAFLVDRFAGLL
jgi:hypothetical protein